MHAPPAFGRSFIPVASKLLTSFALVVLAGCASGSTNTIASNSTIAAPVASADSSHQVERVSEALGQRLDGMLGSQHGNTISR